MFPFCNVKPITLSCCCRSLRPWIVWNNDQLLYRVVVVFDCDCPVHFLSSSPFWSYLLQISPVHVEEQHPGSTWLITIAKTTFFFFTLCFLPFPPFCEDLNLVILKAFEGSCQKLF